MLQVELVYVNEEGGIFQVTLDLKQGATVADALEQSKLFALHPEAKDLPVGIYSKQVTQDTILKAGDRVELYRPLSLDPKEKRRLRARKSLRPKRSEGSA